LIDNLNPLQVENWDILITNSGSSSFFHTKAWAKVLYNTYNYLPVYFTYLDPHEDIFQLLVPMMQVNSWLTGKRGVSLPFSDTCPLIVKNEINFSEVYEHIIEYGRHNNWEYIELRDDTFLSNSTKSSTSFYEHKINLDTSKDQFFSELRNSNKRNIKKANKESLDAFIDNTFTGMMNYYDLHVLTRKRQGVFPQSRTFFSNIYKYIINKNKGNIFFVSYKDKLLAGMVFFHFGGNVLYKFGASDFKYQHFRANNFLMWTAINWYIDRNYNSLNLGKTAISNQGLRQFKMGWNVHEKIINYYKFDLRSNKYKENFSMDIPIVKKFLTLVPCSLLELTGRILYKHVG
jgi:hypothetical protein